MKERQKKTASLDAGQTRRTLILVYAGALCIGAAFLAAALLLGSCSAQASSLIKADGGARISVHAEMPQALTDRFRKLVSIGGSTGPSTFFDAQSIRKAITKRPGLSVLSIEQPGPNAVNVELSASSLEALAAEQDIKKAGLLSYSKGPGWAELRFRLTQGEASALSTLMPGVDPDILDALSPPALEEDPVTAAEYKTMLKSVLGEKVMPQMEAAALKLSITAPGTVLGSGGGTLDGSTLSAKLAIIDLLVLEKPIELWIRWKN
jgi:hypothetical protein